MKIIFMQNGKNVCQIHIVKKHFIMKGTCKTPIKKQKNKNHNIFFFTSENIKWLLIYKKERKFSLLTRKTILYKMFSNNS